MKKLLLFSFICLIFTVLLSTANAQTGSTPEGCCFYLEQIDPNQIIQGSSTTSVNGAFNLNPMIPGVNFGKAEYYYFRFTNCSDPKAKLSIDWEFLVNGLPYDKPLDATASNPKNLINAEIEWRLPLINDNFAGSGPLLSGMGLQAAELYRTIGGVKRAVRTDFPGQIDADQSGGNGALFGYFNPYNAQNRWYNFFYADFLQWLCENGYLRLKITRFSSADVQVNFKIMQRSGGSEFKEFYVSNQQQNYMGGQGAINPTQIVNYNFKEPTYVYEEQKVCSGTHIFVDTGTEILDLVRNPVYPNGPDTVVVEIPVYDPAWTCTTMMASLITKTLIWSPAPHAPVADSVAICGPGMATLTASDPDGYDVIFNWYSNVGLTNLFHTGETYTDEYFYDNFAYVYFVTSTANGCESEASRFVVWVMKQLQVEATVTEGIQCYGGTAPVDITVTGGTEPYTLWYKDEVFNGYLPYGEHIIIVKDFYNCEIEVEVAIEEQPEELTATSEIDGEILCYGGTVPVKITATGGTGEYTFWLNDEPYEDYLPFGPHTIIVKDENGCEFELEVAIETQPEELSAEIEFTEAIKCNGGNATVEILPTGGTEPYSVLLNGEEFDGLLPFGTHIITVVDANECEYEFEVAIETEPEVLTASYEIMGEILCYGGTVLVDIFVAGGTEPYTLLFNGEEFDGYLPYGEHTITVVDKNGCEFELDVEIEAQPEVLDANYNITVDIQCNGGYATVEILPTGGTDPYTLLFNGEEFEGTIELLKGTHEITVVDANECEFILEVDIESEPALLGARYEITEDIQCYGGDATVEILPTGGTDPYTYWYFDEEYEGYFPFYGIIAFPLGTYAIKVVDDNGCEYEFDVVIDEQPEELGAYSVTTEDIQCYGGDATVEIHGTGGTSPYLYYVDSENEQSEGVFYLPLGTYAIKVVDFNGCEYEFEVAIEEEPEELAAGYDITAPVPCNGGTATVVINPTGGTEPYTYIYNGVEQPDNEFELPFGNHPITVVDANGCETEVDVEIIEPEELYAEFDIVNEILCFGGDAIVEINATGGTSPYTYIYNGVEQSIKRFEFPLGEYPITVVDARGCEFEVDVIIDEEPDELVAYPEITEPIQCYGGYATVEINATGGVGEYEYWIDGEGQVSNIFELPFGTHIITVYDENKCSTDVEVEIEQPEELDAGYDITNSILCFGEIATVVINATGGTEPYTYKFEDVEYEDEEFELPAGNYVITVVDDNGCEFDVDVEVIEPDELVAVFDITEEVQCHGGNATVVINPTGGTGPYTYIYSGVVQSSNLFTFPVGGPYEITVVDINNCEYIVTGEVTFEPDELDAYIEIIDPILCYGGYATVEITVTGGTEPYTFWNGTMQEPSINFDLPAGNYTIKVVDGNGCEFEVYKEVTQPDAAVYAVATVEDEIKCYGGNAKVVVTATGGTGELTYWIEGVEVFNPIYLPKGYYVITVKDDNECAVEVPVDIAYEPEELTATYDIPVPIECYGGSTAVIFIPTGGTGDYTFWKGTTQVTNPLQLPFGEHSITVKDENNCEYLLLVDVDDQPDEVIITINTWKNDCKKDTIYFSATCSEPAIIRIQGYGYDFANYQWVPIPQLLYQTVSAVTAVNHFFTYTPGYDYINFIATAIIGNCEYSTDYTETINHGNLPMLYAYPVSKYVQGHNKEDNNMLVDDINKKIVHYFHIEDYCKTEKNMRLAVNYSYWWRENEDDIPIKVFPISDYLYQAPGTGVLMNFSTEMPCIATGASISYNYVNNQGHFPYEGGWMYQTGNFNFFRLTFFDQREITVTLSGFTKPGFYTVEYELVTHINPLAPPPGHHGVEYSINCGGKLIGGNSFYSGNYIEKVLARRTMNIEVQEAPKIIITGVQKADVKVYPNPTSEGTINLQFENIEGTAQVRVLTMNGITVLEKKIVINEGEDVGITLPNLQPGIYFVNVISENAVLTRKLIVANR